MTTNPGMTRMRAIRLLGPASRDKPLLLAADASMSRRPRHKRGLNFIPAGEHDPEPPNPAPTPARRLVLNTDTLLLHILTFADSSNVAPAPPTPDGAGGGHPSESLELSHMEQQETKALVDVIRTCATPKDRRKALLVLDEVGFRSDERGGGDDRAGWRDGIAGGQDVTGTPGDGLGDEPEPQGGRKVTTTPGDGPPAGPDVTPTAGDGLPAGSELQEGAPNAPAHEDVSAPAPDFTPPPLTRAKPPPPPPPPPSSSAAAWRRALAKKRWAKLRTVVRFGLSSTGPLTHHRHAIISRALALVSFTWLATCDAHGGALGG